MEVSAEQAEQILCWLTKSLEDGSLEATLIGKPKAGVWEALSKFKGRTIRGIGTLTIKDAEWFMAFLQACEGFGMRLDKLNPWVNLTREDILHELSQLSFSPWREEAKEIARRYDPDDYMLGDDRAIRLVAKHCDCEYERARHIQNVLRTAATHCRSWDR